MFLQQSTVDFVLTFNLYFFQLLQYCDIKLLAWVFLCVLGFSLLSSSDSVWDHQSLSFLYGSFRPHLICFITSHKRLTSLIWVFCIVDLISPNVNFQLLNAHNTTFTQTICLLLIINVLKIIAIPMRLFSKCVSNGHNEEETN